MYDRRFTIMFQATRRYAIASVFPNVIDAIHITAMMNKKQGLEGKCVRQYVNRDVTSLERFHVLEGSVVATMHTV